MKTDILKGDTYSLIDEVPEDDGLKFFVCQSAQQEIDIVWRFKEGGTGFRTLPPGQYTIVGKGNYINEEQWKGIVDDPIWIGGFGNMYSNYVDDITHAKEIWKRTGPFNTATESGHSWIRSHGMKPETCLVLKKVK